MSKKYSVNLSNCGNPDFKQNPNKPLPDTVTGWLDVDSIAEARAIATAYIQAYDLGGGNWSGGQIKDNSSNEVIAQVSSNGRVWDISEGKTINDYIEYPILASENTFSLAPIRSIDYAFIVETLIEKSSAGVDCFMDADTWVGSDVPVYGSPLGFDINIFEGETGDWIADAYSLKINSGVKGVDTSGLGNFKLDEADIARIKQAYLASKNEKHMDIRPSAVILKKLDEPRGALTVNGFNYCKGNDFYEVDSMESFKALCSDINNNYGGMLGQFVKLRPGHPANPTNEIIVVVPSVNEVARVSNERFLFQKEYAERNIKKAYSAVFSNYTETIRTPIESYCIARMPFDKESGSRELDFAFGDGMIRDFIASNIEKIKKIPGIVPGREEMIFNFTDNKPDILGITKAISEIMKDCASAKAKMMDAEEFESVFTTYVHGSPVKTSTPYVDMDVGEILFKRDAMLSDVDADAPKR